MPDQSKDLDELISALRCDLPTEQDDARIRSNLARLGVLIGPSGPTTISSPTWPKQQAASWAPATLPGGILSQLATGATASKTVAAALALGMVVSVPELHRRWVHSDQVLDTKEQKAPLATKTSELKQSLGQQDRADSRASSVDKEVAQSVKSLPLPPKNDRLPASQLEQETRVLEQAIAAAQLGKLDQALRYLDEHAAKYPGGLLAPERERLRKRLARSEDWSHR